jgi:hypothetical protein
MGVASFTVTSDRSYPTKLNARTDPFGAETVNLPSASLAVPLVVPLTRMLTPGSGSLLSSLTVPDTVISSPVWANNSGGEL